MSGQLDNSRHLEALNGQRTELLQRMDATAKAEAREIYLDALNRAPHDHMLHENFAQFLQHIGDIKQATAEWQQASELSPRNPYACYQAGQLLAYQSQWTEAQAALSNAVALHSPVL